jgi:hypothetical protein
LLDVDFVEVEEIFFELDDVDIFFDVVEVFFKLDDIIFDVVESFFELDDVDTFFEVEVVDVDFFKIAVEVIAEDDNFFEVLTGDVDDFTIEGVLEDDVDFTKDFDVVKLLIGRLVVELALDELVSTFEFEPNPLSDERYGWVVESSSHEQP